MACSVFSDYLRGFLNYEFTSGNLNSISYKPLTFHAIPGFILRLVLIGIPVRNFFILAFVVKNKFGKKPQLGVRSDSLAVTVSPSDIYFGYRFADLANFDYIHINRITDTNVPLSLYRFLNFGNLIFYLFLIPFILTKEFLLALNIFSHQISLREKFRFMHEVIVELSSGQFLIGKLIDCSFANIFESNAIKNIVLPFEGRNWEKRVFGLAKKYGVNAIGVIHSAITSCHKSVYDFNSISTDHIPKFVLTPGRYFTNSLVLHGWPKERVISSCYLRGVERSCLLDSKQRVIFSLTGNLCNSASLLHQIRLIDDSSDLIFIALNERASSYSKLNKLVKRLGLRIWDNKLSPNSIVLTSSTSHFLECLHKRIKVLLYFTPEFHCQPGFDLAGDPIRNLTVSFDYISSFDSFSLHQFVLGSSSMLNPSDYFDLSDDFSRTIYELLEK